MGGGSFEINLVPQIKRDALRIQKIRNIVIFCCIILGTGCGIILAIFGTTFGVQRAITISRTNQINENHERLIARGDLATGDLTFTDGAGLRYFLTIQHQLDELHDISQQKTVFSRVLNIVADAMPRDPQTGYPVIQFSELSFNINNNRVLIDAQSVHGFPALNALEAQLDRLYFDFGVYRGPDGQEVEIIREGIVNDPENPRHGVIYGVVLGQDGSELRIYRDRTTNEAGFHFDSACLQADGVTSSCKLIIPGLEGRAGTLDEPPNYEINVGGLPTLRFRMSFMIEPDALNIQSRFVRVLGIPRQDVTDSFLQINNNWFAPEPTRPEDQL
ncbi:hypothetical protein FWC63_02145 [Candidatus Saccharibacteria bacterium]|nr:hypothetical protein [Candidatus Saccharibacteria bacterium]